MAKMLCDVTPTEGQMDVKVEIVMQIHLIFIKGMPSFFWLQSFFYPFAMHWLKFATEQIFMHSTFIILSTSSKYFKVLNKQVV